MTIDEAIKILDYHEPSLTYDENPDIRLALALGLEALKRDLHNRLINNHPDQAMLPGETNEST